MIYCDYIADLISRKIQSGDDINIIKTVGLPALDLDADGAFSSTKKTIKITDRNNVQYRITVESL